MRRDNHLVILKSTECEKGIGVHIDNELNFRLHINTVSKLYFRTQGDLLII